MKSKIISFLVILALLIIAVRYGGSSNSSGPVIDPKNTRHDNHTPADENGFKRNISYLEYTVHARCRMECRHITQEEVKDIMVNGTINYSKSDMEDKPCPTYALEGHTQKDNQHVRIVFAQCAAKTKVVTCIDLDNDFVCDCK